MSSTIFARRTPSLALALLVVALALGALAAVSGERPRAVRSAATVTPPSIVFVLTDDLSWDLIDARFTPHIVELQQRGVTFSNYFVSDSLCCPSRSSIFTGLYPHNTQVLTNLPPLGGFQKFQSQGLDEKTWAVAVQSRGYRTSMLGKYLNGYGDPTMTSDTAPVPPGWSDWHVSNVTGYLEFNYVLNDNGTVNAYGGPTGSCGVTGTPDNYGVDVLSAYARSFIDGARGQPFVVEVSTFATHAPYIPAERNACDFPDLTAPRDPSFDTNNVNPPAWLGERNPLTANQITRIDTAYRMRAQAAEAVDQLVADVEATLAANGLSDNTYIVFSSDNGYHLGQHRLTRGKQTAFDTDIRVPLIVAGPGVPMGATVSQVAQNVDLYPTFVQLAGERLRTPNDGHSLLPLLHPRKSPPRWRTIALVEHQSLNGDPSDPDFEDGGRGGNPTTYEAIRISTQHLRHFGGPVEAVYVEYDDAAQEIEYYDIRTDPFEQNNIAGDLTPAQRAELHKILARFARCHGGHRCWAAGLPR